MRQPRRTREKEAIKKMADLIRSGAVMLGEKCPVEGCTMPLFRLKTGEIICPVHGRVYIVKTDEEAQQIIKEATTRQVLEKLEKKILEILDAASRNPEEYGYRDIIGWLEALERIKRITGEKREEKQ